jgi:endonuclease/exonuclease/phosphatase (EEP) superfamily protein YafD
LNEAGLNAYDSAMIRRVMTVRGLLVAATSAAAGLALVSGFEGPWHRLEALAVLRWHFAGAALAGAVAAGWPGSRPVVRLAIAIAGCIATVLSPPALARIRTVALPVAQTSHDTLTVLAFNSWDRVRNEAEIERHLRQAPPDIVVLSEIVPPKRGLLERLRDVYPWQVDCADHWPCAMALLSRLPLAEGGIVRPTDTTPAVAWGRIAGEGGGITVLGVHVHRPTRSMTLHRGHMRGLAQIVRRSKGARVVAGDFNAPAWSAAMRTMRAATGLTAMPRTLPTWPARLPQLAIDHVLVSPEIAVVSVGAAGSMGSDHLAVLATLRLPVRLEREADRGASAERRVR